MSCMGQNGRPVTRATKALAAAIREAEGAADLSTAELARRSGVPYSTLRKIRQGLVPIDYEELRKIADGLKVSAWQLGARAEAIEASDNQS